jgi:diguanylate cyclase (GGDEF)-like protein
LPSYPEANAFFNMRSVATIMDNLASLYKMNPLSQMTIRMRIILFSILVTFIPAAGLGWLFYQNNQEMLAENVNHELVNATSAAELTLNQWFQSREYDLKAFSGSFVLTENLAKYYRNPAEHAAIGQDIGAYFSLLLAQFPNVRALVLFDKSGQQVSSHATDNSDRLWAVPTEVLDDQITPGRRFIAVNAEADAVLVGLPIYTDSRSLYGWLASSLPLAQLRPIVAPPANDEVLSWLLVENTASQPRILLQGSSGQFSQPWSFSSDELQRAIAKSGELVELTDKSGVGVFAVSADISGLAVNVILLRSKSEIFANIDRLKNVSLLFAAFLMFVTGVLSLVLARSILNPIVALKAAAEAVSEGNLTVSVRHTRDDELGQVIAVFNDMVTHLSESHDRLEILSITDPLTGLYNRKRMMTLLSKSIERYKRYHQVFSILMVDIDHFKQVNDLYGHQAGDAVLERMGGIFQEEIRTIDVAARYGGEEFILLLDQIGVAAAYQTAERIRKAVEDTVFSHGTIKLHCTLSIGVSAISDSDQTGLGIIAEADAALYKAKGQGRNRTVIANSESDPVTPPPKTQRKKRKKRADA